jgi:hypothetical protein
LRGREEEGVKRKGGGRGESEGGGRGEKEGRRKGR